MRSIKLCLFAIATATSLASQKVDAQMEVLLDFGSAWEANLITVASSAGVDPFSPMEIEEIESIIKSEFDRVFGADFLLGFSTTTPSGAHTVVDFGATTTISGLYGMAPVDRFNTSVSDVASVYSNNFDFTIDEFSGSTDRADQITQLSTALASTGMHELGHSIGIVHEHSYGTIGITPDSYGDTLGVQNAHIMATGSTGISEIERETPRTLSPFSKLMLESAGGLESFIHGFSGTDLAPDVVLLEDEYITSDAGKTFATATVLELTDMPISGFQASHVFSDITGPADADFFALETDSAGFVSAQIVSSGFVGSPIDGILELFGPDFSEIIGMDGTYFDGDMYGAGALISTDPFMVNVFLPDAGTYYFRVSNAAADFGDYSLLVGYVSAIPEPGSLAFVMSLAGLYSMRRRRST